jgi:hypothetical protein
MGKKWKSISGKGDFMEKEQGTGKKAGRKIGGKGGSIGKRERRRGTWPGDQNY